MKIIYDFEGQFIPLDAVEMLLEGFRKQFPPDIKLKIINYLPADSSDEIKEKAVKYLHKTLDSGVLDIEF